MKNPDQPDYPNKNTPVDSTFINYVKVGKGPAIVFIHGWSNNWKGWANIIPYLKDHYTLIIPDLPGFGDSGNLPNYSVHTTADKLAHFIRILGVKPVGLVGLSMGTFVAAYTSIRHPSIAQRVVLLSPILRGRGRRFLSRDVLLHLKFLNKMSATRRLTKSVMSTPRTAHMISKYMMMYHYDKKIVEAYGIVGRQKMRIEAFIQMGISACGIDPTQMVARIPRPTLLLLGDQDKVASLPYIREKVLPKSPRLELGVVTDAGHSTHWDQPEEVSSAIDQFISASS